MIEIRHATKRFGAAIAVDDVTLTVPKGSITVLVGTSGSGKTTLLRMINRLIEPTSGEILVDGVDTQTLKPYELRRRIGYAIQGDGLFPHRTVAGNIGTVPALLGWDRARIRARVSELMELFQLDPATFARRMPHELSGGQRQRVNIARALALRPRLVILDEAVSALDKSVEAQVLNMLVDLKTELGLTYIFISHDLNVVQYLSDRVLVMYLGKIVELGSVEAIYGNPQHPYTRALLSARPSMDPRRHTKEAPIQGDPPNPIDPPSGCRFRTRCPFAEEICARVEPPLADIGAQAVACHMRVAGSGHSKAATP